MLKVWRGSKLGEEGPTSSITKYFTKELLERIVAKMGGAKNDLLLFIAADESLVNQALDHLRRRLAKELGLIDPNQYAFAWITEFPLLQWDRETQNYACEHHPFTSPRMRIFHYSIQNP